MVPVTASPNSCAINLGSLGRITTRRMFGKTGVFCGGLMLGMVLDDTLYFRVDDPNRGGQSHRNFQSRRGRNLARSSQRL